MYDQLDVSYPTYFCTTPALQSSPAPHQAAICTVVSGYLCPSSGHAKTFNYNPTRTATTGYDMNDYGMLEYVGITGSNRQPPQY